MCDPMNVALYQYQLFELIRALAYTAPGAGPTYWAPVYFPFPFFSVGYF
jgi:hypothetical protein